MKKTQGVEDFEGFAEIVLDDGDDRVYFVGVDDHVVQVTVNKRSSVIGLFNRGPMTASGMIQMLRREFAGTVVWRHDGPLFTSREVCGDDGKVLGAE
jgi:hypothetical protein